MNWDYVPADNDGPGKLAHLAEECAELIAEAAEVVKEVQKITRFGADTKAPENSNCAGTTPRQRLRAAIIRMNAEIADVSYCISRLNEALEL